MNIMDKTNEDVFVGTMIADKVITFNDLKAAQANQIKWSQQYIDGIETNYYDIIFYAGCLVYFSDLNLYVEKGCKMVLELTSAENCSYVLNIYSLAGELTWTKAL